MTFGFILIFTFVLSRERERAGSLHLDVPIVWQFPPPTDQFYAAAELCANLCRMYANERIIRLETKENILVSFFSRARVL